MTYIGPQRRNYGIVVPQFREQPFETFPKNLLPILAFDPGGTTGWSLLVLPKEINGQDVFSCRLDAILANRLIWEHGELVTTGAEDEAAWQLAKICKSQPSAAIIIEDFILRAERKEKSRDLLSPVRLTAKLEVYLWRQHRRAFKQQAGEALGPITDARLNIWNCLADDGLPDHARDADRHVVQFVRRCIGPKGVSIKQQAWPHLYTVKESASA